MHFVLLILWVIHVVKVDSKLTHETLVIRACHELLEGIQLAQCSVCFAIVVVERELH